MIVHVNGARREMPAGGTIATLLETLEVPGARGVAVAVGAEVVPRRDWERRELAPGERVEVVSAIQGG